MGEEGCIIYCGQKKRKKKDWREKQTMKRNAY
jgi:hypothetical protein